MELEPTERFSRRACYYARYRPQYPPEIIDFLAYATNLTPTSVIADMGSGTGILSKLFLDYGNVVFGIEPNDAMRAAAERLLARYPNFKSIQAMAEATTLNAQSVDLIVAGQAFHWFEEVQARREFKRILRPHGYICLVWNYPRINATPFLRAYEQLLAKYGTDYSQVKRRDVDEESLRSFFMGDDFGRMTFSNAQFFDFEGLRGRLLSSSFVPLENDPQFSEMIADLQTIFLAHEENDRVIFDYETKLYYGQLKSKDAGA